MDNRLDPANRALESELAQIGHEIHDALIPLLFAASAQVQSLLDQPPEAVSQSQLAQLDQWLGEAQQTARRLLTQVYPPELEGGDWSAAAMSTLQRILDTELPAIDWKIEPEALELSPSAARVAYRIVVEAVRNAVAHGKATGIEVTAAKTAGTWQIEIADAGRGFDPQQVPAGHFGIRAMQARAESIGGSLDVQSQPGGPTRVRLRLS